MVIFGCDKMLDLYKFWREDLKKCMFCTLMKTLIVMDGAVPTKPWTVMRQWAVSHIEKRANTTGMEVDT